MSSGLHLLSLISAGGYFLALIFGTFLLWGRSDIKPLIVILWAQNILDIGGQFLLVQANGWVPELWVAVYGFCAYACWSVFMRKGIGPALLLAFGYAIMTAVAYAGVHAQYIEPRSDQFDVMRWTISSIQGLLWAQISILFGVAFIKAIGDAGNVKRP